MSEPVTEIEIRREIKQNLIPGEETDKELMITTAEVLRIVQGAKGTYISIMNPRDGSMIGNKR